MSELSKSLYAALIEVPEKFTADQMTADLKCNYMLVDIPENNGNPSPLFIAAYLINGAFTTRLLSPIQLNQFNALVTTARENWKRMVANGNNHKALHTEVINAR